MAVDFYFYLTDEDTDRLFAIKKLQGHDNLNGAEFAQKLLSEELYRLFPTVPDFDEYGNVVNVFNYKGNRLL